MPHYTGNYGPEPVAIIGMGCRLPGGVTGPSSLWTLLEKKRSGQCRVPSDRFNVDAYYHENVKRPGSIHADGGYFIQEDLRNFDPTFFGIGAQEASEIDPQQRKLLEVVYECMESSGTTLDDISNTETACYVGCFTSDYMKMAGDDPDSFSAYHATGTGVTLLSNRISYVFNLKGPSLTLDTACSSSMYAFHLACQAIKSGECKQALVCGTNLVLNLEQHMSTAKLGILSPTSTCHTFDASADGYGRADGVGALLLKPLSQAIADGNPIRAIIRGTAINANGKTGGLTAPSVEGQAAVIRRAYQDAGLLDSIQDTTFFECHGTGTPVGDPIEVDAVGSVFAKGRSLDTPLLIGSTKTNLGHSEATSAITSIIKVVLSLERGFVPGTVGFKTPNPKIDFDGNRVKVVADLTPYPTLANGIRRASINSFGYGGANAHAILESYVPGTSAPVHYESTSINGHSKLSVTGSTYNASSTGRPYLLCFSANSEPSLEGNVQRALKVIENYPLQDVAWTLFKRSRFPYRAYTVAGGKSQVMPVIKGRKKRTPATAAFVFTGQGAQWPQMGYELLQQFPTFRKTIRELDNVLLSIPDPPTWTLEGSLSEPAKTSPVNTAALSQPLCTAIQIALVTLLKSWNITPVATVGHSSGEIAAAFAAGLLTAPEAMATAYYRGLEVSKQKHSGAMCAVALSAAETQRYISEQDPNGDNITIACVNSSQSVTISGDADAVTKLQQTLTDNNVLTRLLRTDGNAYHSRFMHAVGETYEAKLANFSFSGDGAGSNGTEKQQQPRMFSSVTGNVIRSGRLPANYWRQNLENQVVFNQALGELILECPDVNWLVEIGPHSALAGPIQQILFDTEKAQTVSYASAMLRNKDSAETILDVAGKLFLEAYPVNLEELNAAGEEASGDKRAFINDLPQYAWNYDRLYWKEPRTSIETRLSKRPRHDLLGRRDPGASSFKRVAWRNVLRAKDLPWLNHHKMAGQAYFPGAGYIAAATEALRQLVEDNEDLQKSGVTSYTIRDADFKETLVVPDNDEGVETVVYLQPRAISRKKTSDRAFEIAFCSQSNGGWFDNFTATGVIKYGDKPTRAPALDQHLKKRGESRLWYEVFDRNDMTYGPSFRVLQDIRTSPGMQHASAKAVMSSTEEITPGQSRYMVHPATIDGCLQLMLIAAHSGRVQLLKSRMIPQEVREVTFHVNSSNESVAQSEAFGHMLGSKAVGTSYLYNSKNECLMEVKDTKFASFEVRKADSVDRYPYMRSVWKPCVDFLSYDSIRQLHPSGATEANNDFDYKKVEERYRDANRFGVLALTLAVSKFQLSKGYQPPSELAHLSHYVQFLNDTCKTFREGNIPYATDLAGASLLELSNEYDVMKEKTAKTVEGQFIDKVYHAMPQILTGRASLLDVAMKDNLLSRLYSEGLAARAANVQLSRVVDLLGHRNPEIDILEVGAGTGGTTRIVLDALAGNSRMKRYRTYTFTDVTTGFLAAASDQFQEYRDMVYTTFDANQAPQNQGITNKYDVVIAANAIHVTPNVVDTLTNIRSLLKPGGKLVLLETTNDNICISFFLGTIREWWIGQHEGRMISPFQSVDRWANCLVKAGYSGLNFALDDYPGDAHITSILVSSPDESATSSGMNSPLPVSLPNSPAVYIVYRPNVTNDAVISAVCNAVQPYASAIPIPCDTEIELPQRARVISLLEAGSPFFTSIDAPTWSGLKTVIAQSSSILWVTTGGYVKGLKPAYGVALGWARTIMLEHPSVRIWTLDLEHESPETIAASGDTIAGLENRLVQEMELNDSDYEFCESQGVVHISRIYQDQELCNRVTQSNTPAAMKNGPINTYENMRLTLEKIGALDSAYFERVVQENELGPNEVEIEARAWGLAYKGVLSMMGKYDSDEYCYEASGVVKRVGSGVSSVAPGMPVMCFYEGDFATILRVDKNLCYPFDEADGFEKMCSIPTPFLTAVHGIFDVARVQSGESILIHSATGALGLAFLQLGQHVGAKIYATVGSQAKAQYLTSTYGLPASQIFLRSDFKEPLLAATAGEGVDVVFNTLNGEAFYDSWACVGMFGRFVELGFGDVYANAKLELAAFAKNVTFSALNLSYILQQRNVIIQKLFERTMKLYREGVIKPAEPLHVLKASQFPDAIRLFMNGSRLGKVVVSNNDPEEIIKYRPASTKSSFPANASYLIIGGLGGLSRSTALWMKSLGARNFIFLSRSAGRRVSDRDTIAELEHGGETTVTVIQGDATRKEDIERAAASSAFPIKGVINGAMVLRDALFLDMTPDQFNAVMLPKVLGTLNLHSVFANHDLDFFILSSSIAALTGTATQSNYCAANSFLDAFSRHRLALGLPSTSINIGMIGEVGYAAENPVVVEAILRIGLHVIYEHEFHDILESVIFHNKGAGEGDALNKAALVTGLEPHRLKEFWEMGFGGGNFWRVDRRFKAIIAATEDNSATASTTGSSDKSSSSLATKIAAMTEKKDAMPLIQEAICYRISRLLLIDADDIDVGDAPIDYGIDSMIGAELRHWFYSELKTDLPFSVILSPKTTVMGLAEKAAESLFAK